MIKTSKKNILSSKIIPLFIISTITFSGCTTPSGTVVSTPKPNTTITDDLQEQLDRTNNSNTLSASNALNQAKIAYGQLVGRLNKVNPLDIEAFLEVNEKLFPPMLIVANSLTSSSETSSEKKAQTEEFKELYFDSLTNMFRGINNNVLIYQSFLESAQVINANSQEPNGIDITEEGILTLANTFYATEITEYFIARIGQFNSILPQEDTQKILNGVKNQQTTILNGIVNFTTQKAISIELAQQAYNIIAKSLTSPNLLNELATLAKGIFGNDNVAFNQNELTPVQPNPNLVVMVIKEDDTSYRLINLDEEGRVVNRIVNDTRGLSASDLLFQSNVNVVKVQPEN